MSRRSPEASSNSNPRRAPPSVRIRTSSSRIRSGETRKICAVQLLDRGQCRGLDFEPKARREAHRPQHPQVIFFKALFRIADGSNDPRSQIGQAADVIHDLGIQGRPRIRWMTDADGSSSRPLIGEVAPQYILLRICFKRDALRMPAIRVRMIAAERRYLHAIHQHHAELRAHQLSPGNSASSSVGPRVGCDIIILRFAPQNQIAHTAAHQPSLEVA